MHYSTFRQGDKVSYVGEKLKGELAGSLGIVCAPVINVEGGLVVDFGKDSIVVHESKLVPFQGHVKTQEEDTKKKEVKVEKRRGKRREASDEE